jgi:hypothetical protein
MIRLVFKPYAYFLIKHKSKVQRNDEGTPYVEIDLGNDVLMPEDLLDVAYIQVTGRALERALSLLGKGLKMGDRQTQYFFGQDVFTILSDYISSVAHVESR